jgi:hypothetical protein
MPIAFDYEILGAHADLLDELESGDAELDPSAVIDPRLAAFIEDVDVDGRRVYGLTAIGQAYVEGYRTRFPPELTLPPPAGVDRKPPTFRDDHYPDGFQDYVMRVWHESPYVRSSHSIPYDGQRGIRDHAFRVRGEEIVLEYRKRDFGARQILLTTATTSSQRVAVVQDLTRRFGKG